MSKKTSLQFKKELFEANEKANFRCCFLFYILNYPPFSKKNIRHPDGKQHRCFRSDALAYRKDAK
jgi:hypothetical protein